MPDYFKRVTAQTATRFWINNVTREEARLAIEAGACGCTQNPSYTWKMMQNEEERPYVMGILDGVLREEPDDNQALIDLQRILVENIAEIFMPVYEASGGQDGYVSIQGDPFDESKETIVRCALSNTKKYPNLMAKIPVIESGLAAIEELIPQRVPINSTEIMAIRQALDVGEMYERLAKQVENPAPIKYSVITGIFDEYIKKYVKSEKIEISEDTLWHAGIAVAKKAYSLMKERNYKAGFIGGGARELYHFTEMVGADCVITINWIGTARELLEEDPVVIQRFFMPVPHSVLDELLTKIDVFRKAYLIDGIAPQEYEDYGPVVLFRESFESAWKNALNEVAKRRKELGL